MTALRIGIASTGTGMARSVAATARLGKLTVLTQVALGDLADELGGLEAALRHLHRVSENTNRPIGVNVATGPEASRTVVIAPRGWTSERLRGWIGAHHEELEAAFGTATIVPQEAPPCSKPR